MKERYLILMMMLMLVFASFAQTSFLRKYSVVSGTNVRALDVSPNGDIYLTGDQDGKAVVYRLDDMGNVIWSNVYSGSGPNPISASITVDFVLVATTVIALDDGAVVAGYSIDTTSNFPFNGDHQRLTFRINAMGEVLWMQHAGTYWNDEYHEGVLSEAGSVILCGLRGSLNMSGAPYLSESDPNTGQLNDSLAFYGTQTGDTWDPLEAVHSRNGQITCAGNNIVLRFDQDLEPGWALSFWPESSNTVGVFGRIDGSAIVAQEDRLILINPTGEFDTIIDIGSAYGTMTSMVGTSSDNIILSGNAVDGSVWLSAFDPMFNEIWTQQFGELGQDWDPIEVKLVNDGRIILLCKNTGQSEMILIMADNNGLVVSCSEAILGPDFSPPPSQPSVYGVGEMNSSGTSASLTSFSIPTYGQSSIECSSELFSVSGTVFHDANGDGIYNIGEQTLSAMAVQLSGDSEIISYSSTNGGGYQLAVGSGGNYVVSHNPGPNWTLTSGSGGYSIEFTSDDSVFVDLNFGYQAVANITAVDGSIEMRSSSCNDQVDHNIDFVNTGTTTPDLLITATFDPLYTYISATPEPDSIGAANEMYWTVNDLGLFENGTIDVQLLTPGVESMGDTLTDLLQIIDVGNNNEVLVEQELSFVLTCAYDPNDKGVSPEGAGELGRIPPDTDQLYYTINFQNTGTDTAFYVAVQDQLSPYLDLTTLQIIGTSHEMSSISTTSGGLTEFKFENIMLPDSGANEAASHGYVHFSVNLQPGLPLGTTIVNNAAIYFDSNPPIITDHVINTLWDCTVEPLPVTLNSFEEGSLTVSSPGFWPIADFFTIQWFLNGEVIEGDTTGYLQIFQDGSYTAHVIDDYGCVAVAGPYQVIGLFVDQTSDGAVLIQPNPFTHGTMISFDVSGSPTFIEILDIQGRSIRMIENSGMSQYYLERGDLEAGVYLIRVQQGVHINVAPVIAE